MNYEFSLTLVNLKIMSLERVSENKKKCEIGTLKYGLLRIRKNLDLGLHWAQAPWAHPLAILATFSPFSKPKCQKNSDHPFRQSHPTELVFQSSTSRNLLFTEWHTGRWLDAAHAHSERVLRVRFSTGWHHLALRKSGHRLPKIWCSLGLMAASSWH